MRNTTDKKLGAFLCAVIAVAVLSAYLALLFYGLLQEAGLVQAGRQGILGVAAGIGWIAVCGLLLAAMIAGVLIALFLRFRELEGGEEEDAKKY